ncbi:hypothetical protein JCM19046_2240 [Bacillus sp. JCM 19046]|nr:hypothetical protein JCM19045_3611 [Bacillus sp. JCM 19045]GAF17715.1 hypothetical protein JCM19046_2240 [Bacillus sp. JCM 19046]
MNDHNWKRRFVASLLEFAMLFPILLYLVVLTLPSPLILSWFIVLYLTYTACMLAGTLSFFRMNWVLLSTASVLSISITFNYSLFTSLPSSLLMGFSILFILLRGFKYGIEYAEDLLPYKKLWKGLSIYLFFTILFNLTDRTAEFSPIITIAACIYIILIIFYSNSETLRENYTFYSTQTKVPRKTLLKNRIFLLLFSSVLFLIVFSQYLNQLFYFIRQSAGIILTWISNLMQYDNPIQYGEREAEREEVVFEGSSEQVEPSFSWVDLLFYLFLAVFLTIVLILLLKYMKKLKKWMSEFVNRLSNRADKQAETYFEEKESVFKFRKWRKKIRSQSLQWLKKTFTRRKTIDDFKTNKEKIRFLFKEFIRVEQKKGLSIKKDSTASELITRVQLNENSMDKEIVRLDQKYNVVRYTDDDASNEDVEALNNWLKKRKNNL